MTLCIWATSGDLVEKMDIPVDRKKENKKVSVSFRPTVSHQPEYLLVQKDDLVLSVPWRQYASSSSSEEESRFNSCLPAR